MDKKDLQKKLNKPYSTENWREVVQFVFPNVQILNPPMVIPIDNDKVESFRQLGNVQLHDGKSLALFELKLKANVNIIRNRVELNNIVSQYIDQDQTHGVLSIFEQGGDDYRFTFSARASEFDEEEGEFITKKTDTKRFTYVLGKNESCKTPAQRFYELSENKNKAEIKDIENAFSVEKLSKAFFKEYKDQYTAFVNYMMQTPGIFKAIYSEDDKAIRDFVKILLGRIIFIKFVQKKGWMGVDASSKKWQDGDYRFLENSFANFKHQDLFYSTYLEPLFEALDEPNRPNDIFTVTNTRVPYLSGGLFELEDKKTKNINFPANYFAGLFEFLDRYNFTIDENDTNDHEVGIDPEMLGHIFENLLEDNKDKGAFYTPKEIVRYMCQESLKEYLKTSLENNKQWPSDATEATDFEQALHNFVTKKEAGGIIEFEETIARALKEVKICDPAIGSGAFPMGLLNEIFQLVHKLHEANRDKVERVWELKGWQPNKVKQNIIQNSIYGVDIEKGAVDVARLRFWLSLIVDEPEPKALPHLDYKIVVGNSLVSKLDDTIIDIDWEVQNDTNLPETDLFGKPKPKQFNAFEVENDEKQKQLLKEISAKQKLFFDPNSDEEKLSLQIRNLKIDLLINQLDAMVKTKGVTVKPTGTSKTIKAQTELWLQTLEWKQQIEKLQKLRKDPNGILHFFDWKLDFPEIMNEQVTDKIGFDIVIGNPPYVRQERLGLELKEVYKKRFPLVANGTADLYVYFFNIGLELLKKDSVLSYITLNKFLKTKYGVELRNLLARNYNVDIIIDFFELPVFEAATDACITKIINTNEPNFTKYYPVKTLEKLNLFQLTSGKFQKVLKDNTEWKFIENSQEIILSKLYKNTISLKDFTNDKIYSGIKTALNEAYVLKKDISDNLLKTESKKIVRSYAQSTDIKKWKLLNNNNYFLATGYDIDIETIYPSAFEYLKKYEIGLKKRLDKGKHWTNLRACKYYPDIDKPKIIYMHTAKKHEFYFDEKGRYINNSCYMIISESKFLFSFLNSKAFEWLKKIKFVAYGDASESGRVKLDYNKMITVPIKKVTNKTENIFKTLFLEGKKLKEKDELTIEIEQQIDNLVYKLYELTYDEVLVVEPEFSERMSREAYEVLKVS